MNNDIVAWLNSLDTVIDYSVCQGNANAYFVVLLIGLQSVVSYAICRSNEKDTLTERLRIE